MDIPLQAGDYPGPGGLRGEGESRGERGERVGEADNRVARDRANIRVGNFAFNNHIYFFFLFSLWNFLFSIFYFVLNYFLVSGIPVDIKGAHGTVELAFYFDHFLLFLL